MHHLNPIHLRGLGPLTPHLSGANQRINLGTEPTPYHLAQGKHGNVIQQLIVIPIAMGKDECMQFFNCERSKPLASAG